MALTLEPIEAHLDRAAADRSNGADHGALWSHRICAARYNAVEGIWRVVDRAIDLAGGLMPDREQWPATSRFDQRRGS
jgi:hypothetical protein